MTDTIFALSSGAPPAAVAIVRISGPAAFDAVRRLAGSVPAPRTASLRILRDPADGAALDRALVLTFAAPASATGEDVAELQLHGGRAVVHAVQRVLAALPGLRPAEAGEFTRRSLMSGRIDLTEAEGLADLLAADTERQHRAAMRSVGGQLRQRIEAWTTRAVMLAAAIEAAIDHGDEADVGDEAAILASVRSGALALAGDIQALVDRPAVERLRDGIRVVLAGPPNSGKSTLINALAQRDVAIVSPIAGTTRDRIEAPVVRNGIAWLFTDTAGLVERTDDPIERIGIARAAESIASADIVVWLGDGPSPQSDAVLVHPRADVSGRERVPPERVAVTAIIQHGVDGLWAALEQRAEGLIPPEDELALNDRQRNLCRAAAIALREAAGVDDVILSAEELRSALLQFDRLTGRADVEAVLDALFSRFCLGK